MAWSKLLERTLVIPLFGNGDDRYVNDLFYGYPNKPPEYYFNTTRTKEFIPVVSWKGFLNTFLTEKRVQPISLTSALTIDKIDQSLGIKTKSESTNENTMEVGYLDTVMVKLINEKDLEGAEEVGSVVTFKEKNYYFKSQGNPSCYHTPQGGERERDLQTASKT